MPVFFLMPSYVKFEKTGDNYFTVSINGETVGAIGSESDLDHCLMQARKQVASGSDDLVFIDVQPQVEGKEVIWGVIDDEDTLINRIAQVMSANIQKTLRRSYTVKVNETSVNLGSYEEVEDLLRQALQPYDTASQYDVALVLDSTREVNVLTTQIVNKEEQQTQSEEFRASAGVEAAMDEMFAQIEPAVEKNFEDYDQGLIDITYADTIEVVEAYLMEDELVSVEEAVDLLTKEQETQVIYKVQSGDTLSQIALNYDIPLDDLIAINDDIESESSTIRVDQEIVITVPEPELSVIWKDEQVYTEDYEAEIQYVPNDNWYTNQQVTLQEPSAGRRKVAAVIEYKNGSEQSREILKEEIYADAVPKIVERGTKIPPTYIKPLSGGRLSSGFGGRKAPTKGASTNHKGVDWQRQSVHQL